MASMPPGGPGQVSGVVVTSTSTGAGTCSEQMVYSYSGNGARAKGFGQQIRQCLPAWLGIRAAVDRPRDKFDRGFSRNPRSGTMLRD